MSNEVTCWFPPDIKPIRDGLYQIKGIRASRGDIFYSYFINGVWRGLSFKTFYCGPNCIILTFQNREWRGIKNGS